MRKNCHGIAANHTNAGLAKSTKLGVESCLRSGHFVSGCDACRRRSGRIKYTLGALKVSRVARIFQLRRQHSGDYEDLFRFVGFWLDAIVAYRRSSCYVCSAAYVPMMGMVNGAVVR